MKALLIVDIQYDFMPDGALGVIDGDKIVPVINQLQTKFPLVVATQDWHPPDHGSFASAWDNKKPLDHVTLGGLDQILWPDHCVRGTKGADFVTELSVTAVEAIFRKGMDREIDSYSAFFDNGHKKSTGLADYLKGKGVQQVFIAGLAADFCVSFSALDALQEGFDTLIIEDATRPIDPEGFEEMKGSVKKLGGRIIRSTDI